MELFDGLNSNSTAALAVVLYLTRKLPVIVISTISWFNNGHRIPPFIIVYTSLNNTMECMCPDNDADIVIVVYPLHMVL